MYSAKYLRGDDAHTIEVETREELVIAFKDVNPGGIYWIYDGKKILERDENWSIVSEAWDLRDRKSN